jgi:hypothetical protein
LERVAYRLIGFGVEMDCVRGSAREARVRTFASASLPCLNRYELDHTISISRRTRGGSWLGSTNVGFTHLHKRTETVHGTMISSNSSSRDCKLDSALIAQLVERVTSNDEVAGSTPS